MPVTVSSFSFGSPEIPNERFGKSRLKGLWSLRKLIIATYTLSNSRSAKERIDEHGITFNLVSDSSCERIGPKSLHKERPTKTDCGVVVKHTSRDWSNRNCTAKSEPALSGTPGPCLFDLSHV
jgi:hypothetical protein